MIPELRNIFDNNPVNKFHSLADFISALYAVTFSIAIFLTFIWLVWGAFQYLTAGGNKQQLEQARSRIIWAIVGLIIIALALLIAQFVKKILQPNTSIPL